MARKNAVAVAAPPVSPAIRRIREAYEILENVKLRLERRRWHSLKVAYPEPSKSGRRSCCQTCRHAGLEALANWKCRVCGCRSCEHAFKSARIDARYLDGTGICHDCRRERAAAFAAHHGLANPEGGDDAQ